MALAAAALVASAPAALSSPADLYNRSTNLFTRALLLKPGNLVEGDLGSTLAPMLLQETHGTNADATETAAIGTLLPASEKVALDRTRGTVYLEADTVHLNRKPHLRFTYVWFYAVQKPGSSQAPLAMQGLRITLNQAGEPAVWEVLADASKQRLIFVSKSTEEAAAREFGPPLPGRRHTIERSLHEAPGVTVARVIEDGPVPMGPMIYLESQSHSVTTVICRCMPAQAKSLAGSAFYDLQVSPISAQGSLPGLARTQMRIKPAFWPGDEPAKPHLEHYLRLPSGF
jgi:hypothetical protein